MTQVPELHRVQLYFTTDERILAMLTRSRSLLFHVDCGKDNTPDKDAMIRCLYCNYRIFYKKRDRKLL